MSLNRFVYYCAVIGGWAAFAAWLLFERTIRHLGSLGETEAAIGLWSVITTTVTATGVGGAIACGLGLVSGADRGWIGRFQRAVSGLIGGAVGGLIGGLVGAVLHTYAGLPRAFGWMIMGLAIGAAEGIYQNSLRRVRNGAIGGGLGGLLGGYLFDVLARPGAEMASRAFAFVVLGLAIGALIGLTHVVLKRAWLTVLDGFRPGRQLILDQVVTVLGRGDHLPLPLLGPTSRDLESEHAKITRRSDGAFVVEDRNTRIGTLLNGQRLLGPVVLTDGDLLRLGGNIVRFNDRGISTPAPTADAPAPPSPTPGVSPPPIPETPGSGGPKPPGGALPGGAVAPRPVRPPQPRPPAPRPPGLGPKLPPPPPPPPPLR
jgi:hypothetical protein